MTSLIVPALYVAALVWAVGGDFLRAQFEKDLERDTRLLQWSAWRTVSLPTLCLVAALFVRLLINVRGLLLTALVVAVALSVWRTYRVSLLRSPGTAGAFLTASNSRRVLPR